MQSKKQLEIHIPKNPEEWFIDRDERKEIFQEEELIITKVGQRKYLVVVCYDIADPKRLKKVADICLGFGDRVQKSVFECHLTAKQIDNLLKKLLKKINEEEDYLRIYRIAGQPQVLTFGKIGLTEEEDVIIV